MSGPRRLAALLAVPAVTALLGCVPPMPTDYYTLMTVTSEPVKERHERLTVGLGPIDVPPYLDRPQIVTRASGTRLALSDLANWAEPLSSQMARVLREDLVTFLGTQQVLLLPDRRNVELDYQVEIDILRFEALDDGNVTLSARWRLYDRNGERLRRTEQTVLTENVPVTDGYAAVTDAMSRTLGHLARVIATAIAAGGRA